MGNLLSEEQSHIIQPHVDGFDPSSLATVIWDTLREIGQDDKHDNFGIDFSKPDEDRNNHPTVTFWDGDNMDQLPQHEFLRILEYIAENTLMSYADLYDLKLSPEIATKTVRLERALDALRRALQHTEDMASDQLLVGGDSPVLPPMLATLPVPGSPRQNILDTIRTHRASCTDRKTVDDSEDDKNCIFTIPEENEDVEVFSLSSGSSYYLGGRLTEQRVSVTGLGRDGSGQRLHDESGRHLSDESGRPLSDGTWRHISDELGRCLSDGTGQRLSDESGRHLSDGTGRHLNDGTGRCLSDGSGRLSPAGQQPSRQHSSDEIGQRFGDVSHYFSESDGADHQFSDDYGQNVLQNYSYRKERRLSEGGYHPSSNRRSFSYAAHSFDDTNHSRPMLQRSRRIIDEDDNTRQRCGMPQLSARRKTLLTRNDTTYSCSSDNSSFEDDDAFRPMSPRRLNSSAGRGMEAVIERLPELRERYERTLNEQKSNQKVRKLKYKLQSLASFKSLSVADTEV